MQEKLEDYYAQFLSICHFYYGTNTKPYTYPKLSKKDPLTLTALTYTVECVCLLNEQKMKLTIFSTFLSNFFVRMLPYTENILLIFMPKKTWKKITLKSTLVFVWQLGTAQNGPICPDGRKFIQGSFELFQPKIHLVYFFIPPLKTQTEGF